MLPGIKRENPFAVPDGYFEKLPVAIADRISKPQKTVMGRFLQKPGYVAGVAGFIAIVVVLFFTVFNRNENELQPVPDITMTEILQENPDFFDNVDEDDIIEIFIANLDDEKDIIWNLDISDDEVIEYLSDDNMDNYDILLNL